VYACVYKCVIYVLYVSKWVISVYVLCVYKCARNVCACNMCVHATCVCMQLQLCAGHTHMLCMLCVCTNMLSLCAAPPVYTHTRVARPPRVAACHTHRSPPAPRTGLAGSAGAAERRGAVPLPAPSRRPHAPPSPRALLQQRRAAGRRGPRTPPGPQPALGAARARAAGAADRGCPTAAEAQRALLSGAAAPCGAAQ